MTLFPLQLSVSVIENLDGTSLSFFALELLPFYCFRFILFFNSALVIKWKSADNKIVLIKKQLALVIIYLGGRFGINCPSAFLKILELPE